MNLLFTIRATAWQTKKKLTFIHQNQLLDFKNNTNTVWRWGTRQKVLEVLEILGPRCFKTFQIKFRYFMFVFYSVLISLRARFSEVPSTHSPCWLLQKVFNTWWSQILHFPIGRAAQQPHYAPLKKSWGEKKRTGLFQCWLRNANSQSQTSSPMKQSSTGSTYRWHFLSCPDRAHHFYPEMVTSGMSQVGSCFLSFEIPHSERVCVYVCLSQQELEQNQKGFRKTSQ